MRVPRVRSCEAGRLALATDPIGSILQRYSDALIPEARSRAARVCLEGSKSRNRLSEVPAWPVLFFRESWLGTARAGHTKRFNQSTLTPGPTPTRPLSSYWQFSLGVSRRGNRPSWCRPSCARRSSCYDSSRPMTSRRLMTLQVVDPASYYHEIL